MGAVDESFRQVELSALPKVFGQRGQHSVQDTLPLPLLEAIVACLIRRIPPREIRPRSSRAQDPEDPIEDVSRIPPRPPAKPARSFPLRLRDVGANRFPLLVRELHRPMYKHLSRAMEIPFPKMEQSRSLTPSRSCRMRSSRPLAGRIPQRNRWLVRPMSFGAPPQHLAQEKSRCRSAHPSNTRPIRWITRRLPHTRYALPRYLILLPQV